MPSQIWRCILFHVYNEALSAAGQHIENGRVIRKWNKTERYVNDVLTDTEVFDYRERMYDEIELRGMLEAVGFKEIRVTKAYEHDVVPNSEDEGIVFSCQKT